MSQRILAATVKTAVNTAALKQVASVIPGQIRGSTTFSGRKAYAVWSNRSTRYGSVQHRDHSFRINYPAMPDDALLTRTEADLIAALTLHETGHVIFTENNMDRIRTVPGYLNLLTLANGFEDGRMEQAVIASGTAKNAKQLFARLLAKLTADVGADWNPCNIANAPFALAVLCRDALGNGNEWSSQLLARIPDPHRSLYAAYYERCKTAPMGFDTQLWSMNIAYDFLHDWREMRRDQPPEQPPEQPQDEQQDQPEQPEQQDDDDCLPPPPSEDDPEDGDDGDSNDGDDGDQPDDGDDDGQPGDDGDDGDEPGDEPTDDDGDQPGDDSDQPGDPDDGKPFTDGGDKGDLKSPEPSLDDMFKRINKRTDSDTAAIGSFTPVRQRESIESLCRKFGVPQ